MQTIVSTDIMRADYARLIKKIGSAASNFIIQPKLLILEQVADSNKNSYRFSFMENTDQDRPNEVKLNRNNAFMATHYGLGVRKQDTSVTPEDYATPIYHYADHTYFDGNNETANQTEGDSLQTIWTGKLSIKTKNLDRIQDLSTSLFRVSPERVYSEAAAVSPGSPVPTHAQYGPTEEGKGLIRFQPQLLFDGQADNFVNYTLGPGNYSTIEGKLDADGTANNVSNVLVFLAYGFEIVNGSANANKWGLMI